MAHEIKEFIDSIRGILKQVPFDFPAENDRLVLDPSGLSDVPGNIKGGLKITFLYEDIEIPYGGACTLSASETAVNFVAIFSKKNEGCFRTFLENFPSNQNLEEVCLRRSIYACQICHLAAVIRAFPPAFDQVSKKRFLEKVQKKFEHNMGNQVKGAFPAFGYPNEYFQFEGDDFDYREFYAELMAGDEQIKDAVKKISGPETLARIKNFPSEQWGAILTQAGPEFFRAFPSKKELLDSEIRNCTPAR